ncbi:MAG: dihydrodipicolinate synthase family protein [Acidobacteria bacterium]|nr:dihydrodipicolinate synthase family protein [Acidobacteriota bacterium]
MIPAVLLPRDSRGRLLWDRFDENVRFLLQRGVSGVCINGATGEYAAATPAERREGVRRARSLSGEQHLVVAAIGAAHWQECLRAAAEAAEESADALLVPVPHFFPYQQDDVAEFYKSMAAASSLPILIYNLPQFAGGVETTLAVDLIRDVPGIAGIKDSSGSLEILQELTAHPEIPSVRILGNDAVLEEALSRGLCQGVISGVACVLPELITAMFASIAGQNGELLAVLGGRLDVFIQHLNLLPVPWGLKIAGECRGLAPATFAMPLSPRRQQQIKEFTEWFQAWWPEALGDTERALTTPSSSKTN